jgi:hypothetical protein
VSSNYQTSKKFLIRALPDNKLPHVPGTVLLNESAAHSEAVTHGLKHGKGSNSDLILSPQPSEDPNDPLNWSQWEKDLQLSILSFGAIVFAASFVYFHCFNELIT